MLAGCDIDLFGLDQKKILNDIYLERFPENGMYYLEKSGEESGGGLLEGVITSIGVKSPIIVAHRTPCSSGDSPGWFIVDAQTGTISGP